MDIIDRICNNYSTEKVTLKVVEECMELCEVLVKSITKVSVKPMNEKFAEEMGDVIFRTRCLARKLGIEDLVEKRIVDKSQQMEEWINFKEKK